MSLAARLRGPLLWSLALALPVTMLGVWLMKLTPYSPGMIAKAGWFLSAPAGLTAYALKGIGWGAAWMLGMVVQAAALFVIFAGIALLRRVAPRPVSVYRHAAIAVAVIAVNAFFANALQRLIEESQPMQAAPTRLVPGEFKRAKATAYRGRVDFARLAFARDRLYVASSIGLMEVQGSAVSAVYRWHPVRSRVDEVWRGPAGRSLWIQHQMTGDLGRLDDAGWHNVKLPVPPRGYTRGDFLGGFKAAANDKDFWLAGGSTVWLWQPQGAAWQALALPPGRSEFEAVQVQGGPQGPIVVRGAGELFGGCKDAKVLVGRADGTWTEYGFGDLCTRDFVVLGDAIYVRRGDGRLTRNRAGVMQDLMAPGRVEAITRSSDDRLIVSVTDGGIFVFGTGTWQKLFDAPYPKGVGEQWVQLAEHDGKVALATVQKPLSGDGYSGVDGLWISSGAEMVRVTLPD